MSSQVTISTGAKRPRRVSLTKVASKKTKSGTTRRNLVRANFGRGIPKSLAITHKYCEKYFITATSTTSVTFRANGLYDPTVAIGGHQPYLYDQVSPLYDHYLVKASRIKLTISNTAVNDRWIACGFVDDDATYSGNINTALERADQKKSWVMCPPGSDTKTIYLTWSLPKDFSIKDGLGLSRFQGTAGTDPTEQSYFHFFFQNETGATAYMDYVAEIEYDTVWTEVADVGGS